MKSLSTSTWQPSVGTFLFLHLPFINLKIYQKICKKSLYRRPLSEILCNNDDPSDCDVMDGLFNYMNAWTGGECGAIKGERWCASGENYVSGDGGIFYAYCARQV